MSQNGTNAAAPAAIAASGLPLGTEPFSAPDEYALTFRLATSAGPTTFPCVGATSDLSAFSLGAVVLGAPLVLAPSILIDPGRSTALVPE